MRRYPNQNATTNATTNPTADRQVSPARLAREQATDARERACDALTGRAATAAAVLTALAALTLAAVTTPANAAPRLPIAGFPLPIADCRLPIAAPQTEPVTNAALVVVRRVLVSNEINRQMGQGRVNTEAMTEGIAEQVQRDIAGAGVPTVRRDQLRRQLEEGGLVYEGIVDPATAAKAGKVVGARFVLLASVEANVKLNTILGRVTRVEYNTRVFIDLVDVQTGLVVPVPGAAGRNGFEGKYKLNLQEVARYLLKSDISDNWRDHWFGKSVLDATAKASAALAPLLCPTTWQVTAVAGERVVLEGGASARHAPGMILEVVEVSDLGGFRAEKVIATLEVLEVQPTRTLARVTRLHEPGATVAVGMTARRKG